MEPTSTNPIQPLRQRATCLEAALSVSLADPSRKAVHELRSETRRVEAQLDLLKDVRGLPAYRKAADTLRRRLRKLRRLAGEVRDCDVQRKLLKQDDDATERAESAADLQQEKDKLDKLLKRDREDAAARLERLLRRQQPKLARALEAVLDALKPSESDEVAVRELLETVERGIARSMRFRRLDQNRLHDVRKAAKRARYQCETLPGAAAAVFARRLEELQDEGGAWHDYLVLAERASTELGADHALPRVLERKRDEHLKQYLEKLDLLRRSRVALLEIPASHVRSKGIEGAQEPASGAKRPPQRETGARGKGIPAVARKISA